ncbi:Thioredoxin reductase [bioreactor metagenome]|uniref:Thioredoxin reductase n=1 Tax=bioreactor metagenome TaxID=1076179 RepID=A0A645EVR5_9ZZZZ
MEMSGSELADKLVEQVLEHGAEVELETVTDIHKEDNRFCVVTDEQEYYAQSVIIATGAKHRQLGLERENDLIGEGISFCAVCDGAFYKDKTVGVVGGGNSALQEAILLSELCKKVYVIQNLSAMTGEEVLVKQLEERANVEFIMNTVVIEYIGSAELEGAILKNAESGAASELRLDGLFIAIGLMPQNDCFGNVIALDDCGYADSGEDCRSKTDGIFVAGDCRKKGVRQVVTAMGDGAIAAVAACQYIDSIK